MSYCQTTPSKIMGSGRALGHLQFATVVGRAEFDDLPRLARLAYYYAKAVKAGVNMALRGTGLEDAVRALYDIVPYAFYAETAYKQALALVENGGHRVEVRRRWVACRGNKSDGGNRCVKFRVEGDHVAVKVRDPWGDWIAGRAYFGRKYLPLLRELEELAGRREEGYGAVITFRDGVRLHIQVPLWLYLKHFSAPRPSGYGLVAGFDLNSDRLNVVVIDGQGGIVAMKTFRYPQVVSPGYPRERAEALRLNAMSQALKFLARLGVDYVAFEDLFLVRKRRFTGSRAANRKITKFAKRQLLIHGVMKALRLGFSVVLVNPKGTTNSEEHEKVMRGRGLDRHMASAYLVALRGLNMMEGNEVAPYALQGK